MPKAEHLANKQRRFLVYQRLIFLISAGVPLGVTNRDMTANSETLPEAQPTPKAGAAPDTSLRGVKVIHGYESRKRYLRVLS